ncbi:MAG TPA: response regulator transcription factor, partial [Ignavibacteria bacterium]|nr:response regulator transcription factor [Ignavibacteria bacterium]
VIFLTARGNEAEEIKGLELGADDFIQKPISPKKLIARVKSNLRKGEKTGEGKNESSKLIIGPVLIDKEQYIVEVNGERKILPKKEFELLYYFASNPGKVLTRDILLKDIWGTDVFVVDRTIDVHIRKIREKLGKFSNLIETVKGVGYKFKNID